MRLNFKRTEAKAQFSRVVAYLLLVVSFLKAAYCSSVINEKNLSFVRKLAKTNTVALYSKITKVVRKWADQTGGGVWNFPMYKIGYSDPKTKWSPSRCFGLEAPSRLHCYYVVQVLEVGYFRQCEICRHCESFRHYPKILPHCLKIPHCFKIGWTTSMY